MPGNIEPVTDAQVATAGSPQPLDGGDLEQSDLRNDHAIKIWQSDSVPKEHLYGWGYGTPDHNQGNVEYIYADIREADDGDTDSKGQKIQGELVMQIRGPEGRDVKYESKIADLDDLRSAAAASRTERPILPAQHPLADQGDHLVLAVYTQSSGGMTVSPSASEMRMVYQDIK